ncbi:MAG TPA: GTPase HflX [Acidimicrobiia bacterium]|jgi:GTP-binding protein HflX
MSGAGNGRNGHRDTNRDGAHVARGRRRLTATEVDLGVVRQRALLVGTTVGRSVEAATESLDELARLTTTAGAEPVQRELQRRASPEPATYIGKGKAGELAEIAEALDVDVAVFDDELTPAQQRNLESLLHVDVVDRVALILDIFAQHATSQEGMVQVELAQLRYRLPRLRGRGHTLSQQGGGIGTRGPGETQLEVDRRRLLRRVQKLEHDLKDLAATRATQRKARRRGARSRVALVGYTNAGKSTLLNRLVASELAVARTNGETAPPLARVADQLFTTLDPTTRRLALPGGETVLLSDTVGFVQRLPHELVEAFRSTLDEAADVELLVHVVDASTPGARERIDAVREVLGSIEAQDRPELLVWNKVDQADPGEVAALLRAEPGSVAVSAEQGDGIDDLLGAIGRRLRAGAEVVELLVPYERGDVLAGLHREAEVLVSVHTDAGTRVQARLPREVRGRYAEYRATPPNGPATNGNGSRAAN